MEALAAVSRRLRRFYFCKTGTFFTEALAALYRLPPAGRFFEKWTPKNTSFGVVVQVASGGFIFSKQRPFFYMEALAAVSRCLRRFYFFKTGTFFTQALAALYRLPPAGRFLKK